MLYCIQCGAGNTDDATFCLKCGQPLYRGGAVGAKSSPKRRTWPWILLAATVFIGLLLLVLIKQKPTTERATQVAPTEVPIPSAASSLPAVITIVSSDQRGRAIAQGSGFILTSNGIGGSNYHVFKHASKALAHLGDGRIYEIGTIEGVDLKRDLVVFQLIDLVTRRPPTDLSYLTIRSPADPQIGEKVLAVGSPEGLESTITDGILSALREIESTQILQITAPISPGSSGGPVLDLRGKVIGVATFQLAEGQNLNFAVSADYVQPLLNQHLGISVADLNAYARGDSPKSREARIGSQTEGSLGTAKAGGVSPLRGTFVGKVFNNSASVSAKFGVVIREDDGVIAGCMAVDEPLFGSGPLEGTVSGGSAVFSVTSGIGRITFEGSRSGRDFNGTYLVERLDGVHETGVFSLHKANSSSFKGDFDPGSCPTDEEFHARRSLQH